jgi:hypothetical protein
MTDSSPDAAATTVAQIEAEIRKRARPTLTGAERKRQGFEKAIMDYRLAAAKCRAAATAQQKRAEELEAIIAEFKSQMEAIPDDPEDEASPDAAPPPPPDQPQPAQGG